MTIAVSLDSQPQAQNGQTAQDLEKTPTIVIRKAGDRGQAQFSWLESAHTFSFGNYYDPQYMGFRSLRVINDDWIAPGRGFGMHGHRDMEIVTYVLSGALKHEDSLGNGSVIQPGDVQRMSAGTGIQHSEFNASDRDRVHLLQIWLLPDRTGLAPSYEQIHVPRSERQGQWRLVAAPPSETGSELGGEPSAVTIHQDARLWATVLAAGDRLDQPIEPGRHAWLHVAEGGVTLAGPDGPIDLTTGDAVGISGGDRLDLTAQTAAELLWFDLA